MFGGQAYYDSVADLTWLTNANAAGTTMDLAAAKAWGVLGGTAGQSIITNHNSNYDLFSNILPEPYWSGTELASNSAEFAWYFQFAVGIQDIAANTSSIYAWAVHSSNVGGAIVPLPAAVWLFASGLLGMTGITRLKNGSLMSQSNNDPSGPSSS